MKTWNMHKVSCQVVVFWSYGYKITKRCFDNLKTYCQKWGLVVSTEKTKTMVLSKKNYLPKTFTFGDIPLQASKSINYLGFVISYYGKYRSITHDRIMEATRMSNMVLQAIRTNRNVPVRLALSPFDKQITPILLYGYPVWSLPDSQNLIYLVNQPECTNIRNLVSEAIFYKLGSHISFAYARREGRKIPNKNRRILIRLNDYDDKVNLLTCANNSPYNFEIVFLTIRMLSKRCTPHLWKEH